MVRKTGKDRIMKEVFVVVHDLPSDVPGLSWKEKNLRKEHNIPIGTLVEVDEKENDNDIDYNHGGIRAFIAAHTRDCDGTPLYTLSLKCPENREELNYILEYHVGICGGFNEESLKVIKRNRYYEDNK